jgi:carotenoid cleavage dioxygenase
MRWQPGTGSRVGLLPREGDAADIVWVEVPECYSFHPLNAYDAADGTVVIDLCVYDRMFDVGRNGPFDDNLARLERWTIDPATAHVGIDVVDASPQEFPRARGSLTAKPHRYGYTAGIDLAANEWPTYKHDLHTGQRATFGHGPGRTAGEPVFVAREGSQAEDDGWLLTFVHDAAAGTAEFVVIDAQDFDRGYVARVPLPQRVPYGFHGNWVSDATVPPPSA